MSAHKFKACFDFSVTRQKERTEREGAREIEIKREVRYVFVCVNETERENKREEKERE